MITSHETPIIGMVHLKPLPGTPDFAGEFEAVLERAVQDAQALEAGGVDGALIQNRWDRAMPRQQAGVETVVAVTRIAEAVREAVDIDVGVHLLRNDVVGSLAIAALCGGSFIRAAALTGQSWTSQGIIEPNTLEILHEQQRIGADHVEILADVWSMHYRPTIDIAPVQLAADAKAAGAAAAVVAIPDVDEAKETITAMRPAIGDFPIILGGHTNHENIADLLTVADGAIVGSAFEDAAQDRRVVTEKVQRFMDAARG